MPAFTDPSGSLVYVPGVYSKTEVISSLPGPLPAFHVPIMTGDAVEGIPYNIASLLEDHESLGMFVPHGTSTGVAKQFGPDSDLAIAAKYAKRHGLPFAWFVAANALTRASVVATSGGQVVDEFKVYARSFGAPGGWIKITCASGTSWVVQPPKHYTRLSADAGSTDKRIYVRDNSWASEGMAVELGSNAVANVAATVTGVGQQIDSNGQVERWIDVDTAPGATLATSAYSLIAHYSDSLKESSSTFTTGQELVDWLRDESAYLDAAKEATFSDATLDALATATPMKQITSGTWNNATVGTSPASTSGSHDALITLLDTAWDDFSLENQALPRSWCIVSSDSTVHASWRDWATAKRTEGWPVNITVGAAWGDTSLTAGNSTDLTYRAQQLNSEDVLLAAPGIDRLASYLSFSPSVFGRRMAGGPLHNLTNDEIIASHLEKVWDERGSGQVTTLHKKGVCTYKLSVGQSIRYRVGQGLSTIQNNASAWDPVGGTSPLVMQRDLADFVDAVIKTDFEELQIGADKVDPSTIGGVLRRRVQKSLERRGYVVSFTIDSITLNESGNGYDVTWSVVLPSTTDFIGVTTRILVGEEAA